MDSTTTARWVSIDRDNGVAVGRSVTVNGVTITPLAEKGEPVSFAVESATPDAPLSRKEVLDLSHALILATWTDAPNWGDEK